MPLSHDSYEHVVVGESWVSLIYAIIQKKKRAAVNLVLSDDRFFMGDKWINYIGELEVKALALLGERYDIPCLIQMDGAACNDNTMIFLDQKMIELGSSPFSNFKELARKLPGSFSPEFYDELSQVDPEEFDREMDAFYSEAAKAYAGKERPKSFPKPNSKKLERLFDAFLGHLKEGEATSLSSGNSKVSGSKQLQYILQALSRAALSNSLGPSETRYLLASALSPRYRLDAEQLRDQLAEVYLGLGGSIKKARAQEFIAKGNKLERILLSTYEGIVKTKQVELFGHFSQELPFEFPSNPSIYASIETTRVIDHQLASRMANKRILFSLSDRIGSDFPHWEARIDDSGKVQGTYAYAVYQGAKSRFYHSKASEDIFLSLQNLLPALDEKMWTNSVQFDLGRDVWLDSSKIGQGLGSKSSGVGRQTLLNGKILKGARYCGPLVAGELGFFGYIAETLDS